mmetsp:Transcript_65385/g.156343  ORF Transcript_65385/g.156343 Transcript_65385/m.156343 type:complete len:313 (+) Transcript_65385:95-1033(+)
MASIVRYVARPSARGLQAPCWVRTCDQAAASASASSARCFASQRRDDEKPSDILGSLRESWLSFRRVRDRFYHWYHQSTGTGFYRPEIDICNCGVELGVKLPRPELLKRDALVPGSREYLHQVYAGAMYWQIATRPRATEVPSDPDMLKGLDVLEVSCDRGGGAWYLTQVVKPKSYIAVDNDFYNLRFCHRHQPIDCLEFRDVDPLRLDEAFEANSFDWILCVQAVTSYKDLDAFLRGVAHVLRPGGRLALCDAFTRLQFQELKEGLERADLEYVAQVDLTAKVTAAGFCYVPRKVAYMHYIVAKPETSDAE